MLNSSWILLLPMVCTNRLLYAIHDYAKTKENNKKRNLQILETEYIMI